LLLLLLLLLPLLLLTLPPLPDLLQVSLIIVYIGDNLIFMEALKMSLFIFIVRPFIFPQISPDF
jgi:hypothetical protein